MKRRGLHSEKQSPSSAVSNGGEESLQASGAPSKESSKQLVPGWSWGQLVWVLVIFRTVNAFLSYTAFVPDEYWQSLEVAHNMVFGYGYLTWEWHKPIRGFTHPLMYAALYKLLALLNLDWPYLLIVLPRVLHVPLAVLGDWYVLKLATLLFGSRAGKFALLCNVASWFTFYCITRTLSNSIEACLTPVVLYYWTLACQSKDTTTLVNYSRLYLLLIGVSCLVRPTGAILWPPLVLAHWIISRRHLWTVVRETFLMGLLTLGWSLAVDCFFYGRLVIVQWNFLEFNVLEGYSALYGAYSWHWYFTEDLPVLLFTSLPLTVLGVWQCPSHWSRAPFWLALWELIVHSALSHKEHRYVLPIVPIASIYAGYCISNLLIKYKNRFLSVLVWILLLSNIPMSLYFSLVHQRGTIAVMDYLRKWKGRPDYPDTLASEEFPTKSHVIKDIDNESSVLFLMPCHTTPFYSHIHSPISMEFLECPPPIRSDYVDISREFYSDPKGWLQGKFPNANTPLPSHLVLFDVLVPKIASFLSKFHYEEMTKLFHTHFPESSRYGHNVVVMKRGVANLV